MGALLSTIGIPTWVLGAREERKAALILSAGVGGARLTF
jgi:hypothetical protein